MKPATAGQAHNVAARLATVMQRITTAARRGGRSPDDVTLIAVSKTVSPERIREAIAAGVADLGENRVQEAEDKVTQVGGNVRWHLIGHLQRNKINKALELFDLLHGVDSVDLALAIGARAARRRQPAQILLQVNLVGKESQFGFDMTDLRAAAGTLAKIEGLELDGLMCIAPESDDPERTRPYFRQMAELSAGLAEKMRAAGHPWRHLSMGMTNDYPIAVEEGATLVRVGRAIFGERLAEPVMAATLTAAPPLAESQQVGPT
jgi:PLP dependent protein